MLQESIEEQLDAKIIHGTAEKDQNFLKVLSIVYYTLAENNRANDAQKFAGRYWDILAKNGWTEQ